VRAFTLREAEGKTFAGTGLACPAGTGDPALEEIMDSKPQKPLRLFVNPFTWTDLAFKAGHALWASAHAAAVRSKTPKVAVIPTADAPAPNAHEIANPTRTANAPRKARALVRHASKAVRKATRGKVRSKVNAKRRAGR
jgi:hypothetical protein